ALQRRMYAWIERQAVTRCQKAVFTTHSALNAYRVRYPDVPEEKFVVIENGYDEDGFRGIEAGTECAGRSRVTLLHSGVLYSEGRDPSAFLEAIAHLKAAGTARASTLRVILRATGDDDRFSALARKYGVDDMVRIEPPVPYREALREMLEVDGLLVFQGAHFNTQVPAKIYEYFRARKPILGLVDPAGETARVLASAGFGDTAPMDDAQSIAPALDGFLQKVRAGRAYIASGEVIAAASRQRRTGELAQVFSEVCGNRI
ncbi:MAG: glycosyltransferase, partial [Bacillota bacterium]